MAEKIPQAQLVEFSKADHMLEIDAPFKYFDGIKKFLVFTRKSQFKCNFFKFLRIR